MKFIINEQIWKDKDGFVASKHIVVMESQGRASCRLTMYPRENVQILSCVYVDEEYRKQGICTEMLDFIDAKFTERKTLVYIDDWAADFKRDMYLQRGYVVMTN